MARNRLGDFNVSTIEEEDYCYYYNDMSRRTPTQRLSPRNNTTTLTTTAATATATSSYEQNESYSYLSEAETAILRADAPLFIEETEEITVNGQRGILVNKNEIVNWRGVLPIGQYEINQDANPEIVRKRTQQQVNYIQELAIRYLKPPTPPPPGEIIITQEINTLTPPAPPLIIRQQPPRPITPQPLVIREAPPPPPMQQGRKVITISGKRLPPPPRKVIIERLPPLPTKPQSVIIERWLPYSPVKRRVIYQRANDREPVIVKPRNVIVQWEAPQVVIKKDFKYLGIIRANPVEYVKRYGPSLKSSRELPDFVLDIKPPNGIVLAADYQYNQTHELEGDLQALRLVDLDRVGLGEYRSQLDRLGISSRQTPQIDVNAESPAYTQRSIQQQQIQLEIEQQQILQQQILQQQQQQQRPTNSQTYGSPHFNSKNAIEIISEIFSQVDKDNNGRLNLDEAEKLLLKLNSRMGRRYGEEDINHFFHFLNVQPDGTISLKEFKSAFEKIL